MGNDRNLSDEQYAGPQREREPRDSNEEEGRNSGTGEDVRSIADEGDEDFEDMDDLEEDDDSESSF